MASIASGGGPGPSGEGAIGGAVTTPGAAGGEQGAGEGDDDSGDDDDMTLATKLKKYTRPAGPPSTWGGSVKQHFWEDATAALNAMMSAQDREEQAQLDPNCRKLTAASLAAIKARLIERHGDDHKEFLDKETRVRDAWHRECDAHGVPKPASTRKVATPEEKAAKKVAGEELAATKERAAAEISRRQEEVEGAEAALSAECAPLRRAADAAAVACAPYTSVPPEALAILPAEIQVVKEGFDAGGAAVAFASPHIETSLVCRSLCLAGSLLQSRAAAAVKDQPW
jgi:hypothetical protein